MTTIYAFAALGFAVYVLLCFQLGYVLGMVLDIRRGINALVEPIERHTAEVILAMQWIEEQRVAKEAA